MDRRLREELATGHDPEEIARAAAEALALAASDFLPRNSPARSRLFELGGWLALHPEWGDAFRGQTGGVTALVERLRDAGPEVRRAAFKLLIERAEDTPRFREAVDDAVEELEGDPYTQDLQRALKSALDDDERRRPF